MLESTWTSYGILESCMELLDGVHVCFTNPTESTSTTGVASRLLNSLNVQCLMSSIVGAKSRLLESRNVRLESRWWKAVAFSRV